MKEPSDNLRRIYREQHQAWWDENNRDAIAYADFTSSEEAWVAAAWFFEKEIYEDVPDEQVIYKNEEFFARM